jgi:hypothetical protein
MRFLFASLRFVMGVLALIAVLATFLASAAKSPINPFNFFGFFTIQGNIIMAVVLVMLAVDGFADRRQSPALQFVRASATAYMIIVGLVYNTLLTGVAGGVPLPWANTVLHVVLPIYALVDWLFFGDRATLPWRRFWIVVVYPLVWCAVVLIRGATDGWVPYPFLDPKQGYGIVLLYVLLIAVAILLVGAGVWALSRVRVLRVADVPARS